jgi:hypothetical protein
MPPFEGLAAFSTRGKAFERAVRNTDLGGPFGKILRFFPHLLVHADMVFLLKQCQQHFEYSLIDL